MTRQEILDLHFIEARSRLIEVAAFLDRVERGTGAADFRWNAILNAVRALEPMGADRARQVLLSLSDPTVDPIPVASEKGAMGAYRVDS
jgi:hypothetical protein